MGTSACVMGTGLKIDGSGLFYDSISVFALKQYNQKIGLRLSG
jgi:hypothetical protein